MNKTIGIISYFPDNEEIRKNRKTKLISLIKKCLDIFNLPFIIIAQNYTKQDEQDILALSNNITLCSYKDKLGITGARKYLRTMFLSSNYDYLIMLDDDCKLSGNRESGINYLKQIDEHPNMFYEFNKTLLKLFAISREVFSLEDFEDISPEKEEGFEDRIFVNKLRKKYPNKQYTFNKGTLRESSISTKDKDSTWYTNQNINKMLSNTLNCIEKIKI